MAGVSSKVTRIEVPKELYVAILKIQVSENLDWDDACRKAAIIIDENSEKFSRLVKSEAEKIYSSRFMQQFNRAKKSIAEEAYKRGYQEGYEKAKKEHAIWYYCAICRERIYIKPNSKSHLAIIKYMNECRWGHMECHKRMQTTMDSGSKTST